MNRRFVIQSVVDRVTQCREGFALLLPLVLGWLLVVFEVSAGEETTNVNAKLPPAPDFSTFRIVPERNIFNATRSGQPRRTERRRPNRVDSFSLVGIIQYEKGRFAFFDGTSPEYRTVLRPRGTIAGYTVLEIAPDRVKLAQGTNQVIELKVGMQMRREDDSEWILAESGGTYASTSSSSPSQPSRPSGGSAPSSGSDEDDVVKRLMQRREMETK